MDDMAAMAMDEERDKGQAVVEWGKVDLRGMRRKCGA
jgi:hypothetical protein